MDLEGKTLTGWEKIRSALETVEGLRKQFSESILNRIGL
jgi:hypothetical protein